GIAPLEDPEVLDQLFLAGGEIDNYWEASPGNAAVASVALGARYVQAAIAAALLARAALAAAGGPRGGGGGARPPVPPGEGGAGGTGGRGGGHSPPPPGPGGTPPRPPPPGPRQRRCACWGCSTGCSPATRRSGRACRTSSGGRGAGSSSNCAGSSRWSPR